MKVLDQSHKIQKILLVITRKADKKTMSKLIKLPLNKTSVLRSNSNKKALQ